MRESLRVRLVLWYALVLTLVVALYGGAVVYQSWRSMIAGVDAELDGYARAVGNALRPVGGGRYDLELPADMAAFNERRAYYVISSPTGEIVDQSDPDLSGRRDERSVSERREVTLRTAGGATVLVGRDVADLRREQWAFALNVALAGIATLGLSIFGGWFVAGRALAPIKRISRAARAMSAGNLSARIAVERTESELEQVASTLNEAFDRLHLAVEQERRFTADASHELRTPISVLRAETEWALDRDRTPRQYKDALTVCRRAAMRMQDAVERMLALVRAETIEDVREAAPVHINAVVTGVLEWLAPVAQERGVRLTASGDLLTVTGDAEQLREALNNIVANAILYNKPGGSVTIATHLSGASGRIEVVDTGIGIPADAIPHIFDRFFRVDKARSREVGGSGLGLSIARAIFVAHGGDITCTSETGTGSVFVISLPVSTANPSLCSPT
ncbi:MAG TPA: ATP-binding protein [Vicinamibacterales bacterium]|nr:ATP-binding protein [Vicinamibacterales bacterium]